MLGPSSRLLSRTFRKPAISNPLRLVRCCLSLVFQPREPARWEQWPQRMQAFSSAVAFFHQARSFWARAFYHYSYFEVFFYRPQFLISFWPSGLLFSPSPTSLLILPHQPQRRGLPSSAVAFPHHSRSFFHERRNFLIHLPVPVSFSRF